MCRLLKLHRSVARYQSVGTKNDDALKARLKPLADQYPRYGYLLLHQLLKNEGLVINRKRTYRLYVELGLQVRTQRRKKLTRPRVPMPVPSRPNERWSVDFMSDQLANGRRFRILNLVDDYSRQCVGQIVDTSISGVRLARYLDELGERQSLPKTLVCKNVLHQESSPGCRHRSPLAARRRHTSQTRPDHGGFRRCGGCSRP